MSKRTPISQYNRPYTEHYKVACRDAWYAAGKPDRATQILEIIPEDEYGRKPNKQLLPDWRREMAWDVWADELDLRAEAIVDDELVNARVIMLKRQAATAKELQEDGIEYLREKGHDTSASAVRAIIQGAELERTSRGISEKIIKLHKMTDEKLMEEAQKYLGKAEESGEVIDLGEEVIDNGEDS